jgi:cobalamin biosynthesis protein CobT
MESVGKKVFGEYLLKFGFGEKTGIELIGEGDGDIRKFNNGYVSDTSNDIIVVPENNVKKFEEARDKIKSKLNMFSRFVEQTLVAMKRNKKQGGKDKGNLDYDKLHMISKSLTRNVFYKNKIGRDLNTCVSIIIDESGSMYNHMKEVRSMTIAIAECLNKLKVPFEIVGTTTTSEYGKMPDGFDRITPIKQDMFKSFKEHYNNVKNRLGSLEDQNNNVDGENLEYASRRLRSQKEPRKIIFSICDGEPCAGHNNYRKMEDNLKDVSTRLRKEGIEVYAFGIGTQAPQEFYGKDFFLYLDSIKNMDMKFFRKFKEIIFQ